MPTAEEVDAAVKGCEAEGFEYERLGAEELVKFDRAFDRAYVTTFPEGDPIAALYRRHKAEILMGAMIARKQMKVQIDGEIPGSGKVGGPIPIRAGFVGIGDDWEDGPGSYTTGAPQNWIHSGTTMMGGSGGYAIRCGENMLLVIIGIRSIHASPKTESVQFTLDGKAKPVHYLGFAMKNAGVDSLKLKEFANAIFFKKDSQLLAKVFACTAPGSSVTDYLELLGAAYMKEPQLRLHDAADIDGTTQDCVMTT